MADNFQVDVINQDTQRLFMKLRGDFDGSSATILLRLINNKAVMRNSCSDGMYFESDSLIQPTR
jgi:hypothetical protein